MAEHDLAVLTEGLRRTYGRTRALDGLDMAVPRGTVHGVLGPNGAGETTLVRTLATLLRVEEGRARVAGIDLAARPGLRRARPAGPRTGARWLRGRGGGLSRRGRPQPEEAVPGSSPVRTPS